MEQLIDRIVKAPPGAKYGGLAGLVLLLTGLNYFFVIQDEEAAIAANVSQQRQLELQLQEKQEIAQNLNERRREMDVLEQKLAEALTELPEKKDIEELLAQLNDIGKKSGLEISTVTPQGEERASFYARIPIQMTVSGNYHEIARFLLDVANLRRIVNVNNIKFTGPTVKNEKVILRSDFLATTFRFLDQGANQGEKKGSP